jgi:hypothetical protein
MEMVDIIVLILILLALWKPFEWLAKRIILRAIRLWNGMDSDVAEISDELDKKKCGTSCRCTTPCEPEVPPSDPKAPPADKKTKTKKGA